MTILFLTGGLEPGKDGVGDYTRRLAFECARNRHDCLLIALNDGNIEIPTETTEVEDHIQLRTLRLPQKLSWPARIKLASVFRAPYSIDWISLQFVCYSFHPKGFGFNLGKLLQPVVNGCPVHLMFHELWVGVGDERLSLKQRLVAGIQRQGIRKLIREIQPRCVTTSNSFYGTLLKNINVTAMILLSSATFPLRTFRPKTRPTPKTFSHLKLPLNWTHQLDIFGFFFLAHFIQNGSRNPFLVTSSPIQKKADGVLVCSVRAVWVKPANYSGMIYSEPTRRALIFSGLMKGPQKTSQRSCR